jgi:hypothetical protein
VTDVIEQPGLSEEEGLDDVRIVYYKLTENDRMELQEELKRFKIHRTQVDHDEAWVQRSEPATVQRSTFKLSQALDR